MEIQPSPRSEQELVEAADISGRRRTYNCATQYTDVSVTTQNTTAVGYDVNRVIVLLRDVLNGWTYR